VKSLIDMNLSPDWVEVLCEQGWEAIHWSAIGSPSAPDTDIMYRALTNNYIVFTHDLDFSALLAASNATGPSVIQIRAQNTMPDFMSAIVLSGLRQFADLLAQGALVLIDARRNRARILPLRILDDSQDQIA